MRESEACRLHFEVELQEAVQQAVQAENRARDAHRQATESVHMFEEQIARMQNQLQESEAAVREKERRLCEVEGNLAQMEKELSDREQSKRQAEGRVMDLELRVSAAVERQRSAEERMIEAENMREQAGERQIEALSRTHQAEARLREETQQRIQYEQLVEQLQVQLVEAERRAHPPANILWRVERKDIHLSQQQLGRGGWATVKVAEFRGVQVAAKCLHSIIISEHNRQLFQREMNIAAQLRHPHLVQFIGATLEGEPIILTELMSTSLRDILERRHLRETQIRTISCHVALALNYMHQITPDPILHRDVSSANVLLNPAGPEGTWVAKLSDYGSANFTRLVTTVGPGNPSYAAPEASNPAQQSPKMDVFSFGVLLMEMATGQFPDRDNLAVQRQAISLSELKELVGVCTHQNPAKRPSIQVVLGQL